MQVPALGFADVAEVAFLAGPPAFHKFSGLFRYEIKMLNMKNFLVVYNFVVRGGSLSFIVYLHLACRTQQK